MQTLDEVSLTEIASSMNSSEVNGRAALVDSPQEPLTLESACALVRETYSEDIEMAYRAVLGVAASLSLRDRDNCVVLILEGAPSSGKTTVCRMFQPLTTAMREIVERVDSFTPKSFVSNAANRSEEQLAKIDLLPRLADKLMLTKELSALFGADDKTLMDTFGTLTSILDGQGHKTNSGSHGGRGYENSIKFNWVGATTPIQARTHNLMGTMGNRMLFYELAPVEASDEELLEFAEENGTKTEIDRCNKITNDLLAQHFSRYPVNGVLSREIHFPRLLLVDVVRYAKLTVAGRLQSERDPISGAFERGAREVPNRVIMLLKLVCIGLALIADRMEVTPDDLNMVRLMAFSSIPSKRRMFLRALLDQGGRATSTQLEAATGLTRPTVLARMRDLAMTGIVAFVAGISEDSTPAVIHIEPAWEWLRRFYGPDSSSTTP